MAVAFRSYAVGNGSNSIVITKPADLAAGDLMIANMGFGIVVTPPDPGWTQIQSYRAGDDELWGKIADSADAAATSFTWTSTSSGSGHVGVMQAWTGARGWGTPALGNDVSSTSHSVPSIVVQDAGSVVLGGIGYYNNVANTVPSGWTDRGGYLNTFCVGTASKAFAVGSTGTTTWATATSQTGQVVVVELLPLQLSGSIASASSVLSGGFTKTGELAGSIIPAASDLTSEIAVAYNSLTGVVTSS